MSLNHDKLKNRRAGNRQGNTWKPKNGPNKVRILPPHSRFIDNWEQIEDLALPFKMHYFKVEGRPTEVSLCLEQLKQKCPACDTWRAHRKSEDPALKELCKAIGPSDQYLFNMLDINNLAAGIQPWGANYTCWDKIMEIAANPSWGNVVNPADGVNFDVTLTPGAQTRSGQNSYSVMPEPQRTTVMSILEQIPDWRATLDKLSENMVAAKTTEEITQVLDGMGFPPPGGRRVVVPQAIAQPYGGVASVTPAPLAPAPIAPVAPAPIGFAPPPPAAVVVPGASAPVAVAPAPIAVPAPVAAVPVTAPVMVTNPATPAPHTQTPVYFDPGPSYTPVVSDAERPAGVPRCYGDYDASVRPCSGCPTVANCQLHMLGIP